MTRDKHVFLGRISTGASGSSNLYTSTRAMNGIAPDLAFTDQSQDRRKTLGIPGIELHGERNKASDRLVKFECCAGPIRAGQWDDQTRRGSGRSIAATAPKVNRTRSLSASRRRGSSSN